MIKAAIIDNELFCIEVIETLLMDNFPNVQILQTFHNPLEAVEGLQNIDIDVLFCDISMPELSGFEVLDRLMPFSFKVVFTTAYENHAIKAMKYGAIDYLLKPISPDDLKECMLKIFPAILKEKKDKEVNADLPKKICITNSDGIIFQAINEIAYCESDNSYTTFNLVNGKKILASKTMKEYENILIRYDFFRIHNSYLINMNFIEMYVKSEGGVVIINGDKVPISRNRKEEFLKAMKKYVE